MTDPLGSGLVLWVLVLTTGDARPVAAGVSPKVHYPNHPREKEQLVAACFLASTVPLAFLV
jgi:hypothetical protein